MKYVIINDTNIVKKYNLFLNDYSVSSPVPKTCEIEVVGRDGKLDLTDYIYSEKKFENRTLTIELVIRKYYENYNYITSEIQNNFAGNICDITFSDDLAYAWRGRLINAELLKEKISATYTLTFDIEPFKAMRYSTIEKWDSETVEQFEKKYKRYVQDLSEITINEQQTTLPIWNGRGKVVPVFNTEKKIKVIYNNQVFTFDNLIKKQDDLILKSGYSTISITADELTTISIEFRERSL